MSVILVTHDLGVIAQMCDRVAVMYAGIIVEMTDTVTLFAHPRHPYTYALMNSLPNQDNRGATLETIEGAPPNLAVKFVGCPFAPRCRYAKAACEAALPEMTEVSPGHLARCHCLNITEGFTGIIRE
jgi:oligopeptide/dipeptide ABC transporter ATP-binding protein